MSNIPSRKVSLAANGTFVVPAGYSISQLVIENTNSHSVTGGVRIGTTNGGVDVIIALAIAGSSVNVVLDTTLLLRYFSSTLDQTLYIQAVAAWNSATLDCYFVLNKLI